MTTIFGTELRQWRQTRGLSQLDLASRAEVSQRHISFLETGRSKPSREMVLHLGRTMEVPPREQNLLLAAAGHTAAFSETPLDAIPDIAAVLDRMLQAHEPNPALIIDRQWNVVASNTAAVRLTALLFPEPPAWLTSPPNIMRLTFHPEGLRRHMVGWGQSATALLRRLERDAASYPNDGALQRLLAEVRSYRGVDALDRDRRQPEASDLLVPFTYVIDGDEISLFTTIAVIGDAHDLTLAELRIETFWPMDQRSAERWLGLVD
jgi:transcriptional regulator with XRE-family HTH domain